MISIRYQEILSVLQNKPLSSILCLTRYDQIQRCVFEDISYARFYSFKNIGQILRYQVYTYLELEFPVTSVYTCF